MYQISVSKLHRELSSGRMNCADQCRFSFLEVGGRKARCGVVVVNKEPKALVPGR